MSIILWIVWIVGCISGFVGAIEYAIKDLKDPEKSIISKIFSVILSALAVAMWVFMGLAFLLGGISAVFE
ncbi:MAG: hypothetical protein ACON4O_00810 [Lentimonas sp.]